MTFTRPVTGRSSNCPFEGQVENCLLMKCRVKRHLDIPIHPPKQRYLSNRPFAGR